MKKWPLSRGLCVQERKLAAELVSKTPRSEERDVWLKPGLLSVCHRDLTQGELFVVFFSVSAVTGDEPRLVAAGDSELFLVVKSWRSSHLKNISLEWLPYFPSFLSVSFCGSQRLQAAETEGGSRLFVSACLLFSLCFFWPAFSCLQSSKAPSSLLLLVYRSELGLRRKIQVKPLSFQTAW